VDPYEGFEEFVGARTASLSRTAYLLTGNHHSAEDLLQVALSRVAARWPQVRDGQPESYARRIMVNEFISWRRRRWYRERPVDDAELSVDAGRATPDLATPDLATAVVRRIVVGRALARLTARQRAVLVLRFYEDLSEAETAEALGCAVGTVKSQTHLALTRIRAAAPELAEFLHEPREVSP
jgi:RNA polymerase sigma-70 factor (sigma-E family)